MRYNLILKYALGFVNMFQGYFSCKSLVLSATSLLDFQLEYIISAVYQIINDNISKITTVNFNFSAKIFELAESFQVLVFIDFAVSEHFF